MSDQSAITLRSTKVLFALSAAVDAAACVAIMRSHFFAANRDAIAIAPDDETVLSALRCARAPVEREA